ncbi:hypothetical protein BRD08_10970 [Halobacteriales archaeon SW_10_66_29]|nr:MAG: hypothetical protein BRD08_10970 [Halobacteriales archaeon SW_10_66_29]
MNNKTQTFREKGRAVFLAAIMVLSVVAMTASFGAAPVAAQNGNISVVGNVDVDPADEHVGATYTTDYNLDDTRENISFVSVDLSDAEDEGVDLSNVDASEVSVTDSSGSIAVAGVATADNTGDGTDELLVMELDSTTDFASGSGDVTVDGITNPDEGESPYSLTLGLHEDSGDGTPGPAVTSDSGDFAINEVTDNFEGGNAFIDGNIGDDRLNPIENDQNVTLKVINDDTGGIIINEVQFKNFDTLAANNPYVESAGFTSSSDKQAGQRGEYFIEFNQQETRVNYTFNASIEGFEAFDGEVEGIVSQQSDRNIRLTRIISAGEIDIVQSSESGLADGEDTITFDVSVFDDNDGSQFSDARVEVDVDADQDNSSVGVNPVDPDQDSFYGDEGTQTVATDENGTVSLEVNSSVIQEVEFNFTAVSDNSVYQTRTKSFIISGEAELQGHAYNKATTSPVEDASVWLVSASRYETNQHKLTLGISALDDATPNLNTTDSDVAGDRAVVRLIDNETKEVIENQNYDVREAGEEEASEIRANDHNSENFDDVRKIEAMNTSDLRQGNGFIVIDDNEDGDLQFNLTGIEPGEYALDVSLAAGNASDQRALAGETAPENFTRITGTFSPPNKAFDDTDSVSSSIQYSDPADIQVPTDTLDVAPAVRTVEENLTLLDAIDRAEGSDSSGFPGANIVDSPGFVNSYGEDTDGTTGSGAYALNRIYSQFQDGVQYVAIASKTGFDADFQDVYVTEDHELTFEESQNSNDFQIEPIDPQPDFVNITNWGLHPPLSQTGDEPDPSQIEEYDNKTDAFEQVVPRDGSVDVIYVETGDQSAAADLNKLNATVDLSVPDDNQSADPNKAENFTGQIVGVFGGEKVSNGSSGDIGTVHTGDSESVAGFDLDEGEAIVLLESDESNVNLVREDDNDNSSQFEPPTNQTGVFAELTNDASATDFSRKDFVGVILFESGSISGDISNDDELLPNTFVWTAEFELTAPGASTAFEVTPNFTASPINSFDDLSDDPAVANNQVNNIVFDFVVNDTSTSPETTIEEFQVTGEEMKSLDLSKKLDVVSDASVEEFNLLRSQAEHENGDYSMDRVPATDEDGVDYRRLTAVQYGSADTGNGSTAEPVRTGFTVEGNVVIVGAQPLQSSFQVSNLTPQTATVNESEEFDVSVDVENVGNLTGTQDIELEIVNDSTGNAVVSETQSVNLGAGASDTVTFEDVSVSDAGDYTHTVSSDNDSVSGSLTVEEDDTNGNDPWYEPYTNDNDVATLDGALDAIDDYESGELSLDRVLTIIDSYETGTPVPQLE